MNHVHLGHDGPKAGAYLLHAKGNADVEGLTEYRPVIHKYLPRTQPYGRAPGKQKNNRDGCSQEPCQDQRRRASLDVQVENIQKQNAEYKVGGIDDNAQYKTPSGFPKPPQNGKGGGIYRKYQV